MGGRWLAALVVLVGVATACSSTSGRDVDVQGLLRSDGGGGAASGATSGGIAGVSGSSDGVAAAGVDGAGSPAAGATASTARSGGAVGGAGAAGMATADGAGDDSSAAVAGAGGPTIPGGPGVSATEIKVGFMVTKNLQAAFGAIGASGQPPNEIDLYRALVAWANANGGVGGRKLVPVFVEVDATTNWQAQAQAACATFTDDNRVAVAVSSVVGGTDALVSCLAPKGVPLVEQNHWLWDQPYWTRFGAFLYQPSRMKPERSIPAGVKALAARGFFSAGHKLGLVRFDGPVFQRLSANVLKPAIAANGGKLVEEVAISSPGGAADLGGVSAQLSNAILRFRAAGVTHVMFLENAGILPFFWNQEANSQGYYPRLGLLSYDLPNTQAGQVDPKVLKDALAAGWAPALDTNADTAPANPATARCAAIMKQSGVQNSSGFGFYDGAACDAVFFLKQALDRAPALTADGLRRSVESLGTSYVSPYTYPATAFGLGRHDGASEIALLRYQESPCGCFTYVTPPHEVP